jgi:hypothetical protein
VLLSFTEEHHHEVARLAHGAARTRGRRLCGRCGRRPSRAWLASWDALRPNSCQRVEHPGRRPRADRLSHQRRRPRGHGRKAAAGQVLAALDQAEIAYVKIFVLTDE